MSVPKGRNCRVEVALTFTTAKVVTAISKANPGVATSSAHALAEGAIGYWSGIVGMTELEKMAGSVDGTLTNTWNVEGVDTTNFGTFVSGNFNPAGTFSTLSPATSYQMGGGDADEIDMTTLLDTNRQIDYGMLGAETVSFDQLSDMQHVAVKFIEAAARAGTEVLFRVTHSNGERRVFYGVPTLPGESMQLSQAATGSFKVAVRGRVLRLPAA